MDKLKFRKRNIEALDAFRAAAILMVCTYHMGMNIPYYPHLLIYHAGWIAVPLFFILSGFLLSLDFIQAGQNKTSMPSIVAFYKRRIFRIFPLYFLALFIYILYKYISKDLPPVYEVIPHFFFLHNFGSENSKVYGPLWSLAVEVQIYALFPLFGYALYKFLKEKNFLKLFFFLLALVLFPLLYRIFITTYYSFYNEQEDYIRLIYASTLSNLDSFGFGIIGAIIYSLKIQKSAIKSFYIWALFVLSISILLNLMHFSYEEGGWLLSEGVWAPALYYSLLNVGWLLMILSALSLNDKITQHFFSFNGIRLISLISFSMYVWHGIVFDGVRKVLRGLGMEEITYDIAYFFSGFFFLILISYFSWKIWELRFLGRR